jgi:hypothetical protein
VLLSAYDSFDEITVKKRKVMGKEKTVVEVQKNAKIVKNEQS